jgi:superfamily II DNA or RNA helicase
MIAQKKPGLYPYQTATVDYVRRNLSTKKSILVVAPVATGKTVIFAELARYWANAGKRVLVLAHREELLMQAKERLEARGLSVGVIKAQMRHLEDPKASVQVASVQTLCRRAVHHPGIDVIIVDEAHHSPARSYQQIIDRYPRAWLVGFTATPVHARGSLADCFEDLYTAIEPADAVEQGYIAPWTGRVWIPPSLSDVKRVNGDFEQVSLGKAMSRRHIVGDIVAKWKQYAKGRTTLLFAATVSQCRVMVKAFRKAGVSAEYLTANSRREDRAAMLARFAAGEFPVLCNVGLFTEGTSIDRVKCILLARPTYSLGLYLQMIGRGRRVWNGETCVIHDHGGLMGQHLGPDDKRDWKLGGASEVREMVICPKCRTPRAGGEKTCPNKCVFPGWEGATDPTWILRGYEYDAEKFLAMRDERRREAIRLYAETEITLKKIAQQLGVSSRTVLKWVHSAGVKQVRDAKRDERRREAIRLYTENDELTVKKIADRLGVNHTTVDRWVHSAGVKQVRDAKKAALEKRIVRTYLKEKDLSCLRLAARLRTNYDAVLKALTKHGVSRRRCRAASVATRKRAESLGPVFADAVSNGVSATALSRRYNICVKMIGSIVRKYGVKRKCGHCGRRFVHRTKTPRQQYCGVECSRAATYERVNARRRRAAARHKS